MHITNSQHENRALFSIKDSGPGIPKERQERIFHRYGRVENNYDQGGSLGLGLYLVKEFIEAHDGRIWVESGLGKGSTFSFEIPLESLGSQHAA